MNIQTVYAWSALCLICACSDLTHHDHGAADHGPELRESFTKWTDSTELFVSGDPLIAGEYSSLTVYLTDLRTSEPLSADKLTASLVQGESGIRTAVEEPLRRGVFQMGLMPKSTGSHELWLEFEIGAEAMKIVVEDVIVSADAVEAGQRIGVRPPTLIEFSKEQAWNTGLAVEVAARDTIHEIIRAAGEILPASGDELLVSASHEGLLIFNRRHMLVGSEIARGTQLFTIAGAGDPEGNLETEFQRTRSTFNQAKAEFDRKQILFDNKTIARAEFEIAQLEYELAKTNFDNMAKDYENGGKKVFSPTGGFIKQVYSTQGEYLQIGDPVVLISQNKRLVLEADVPQGEFQRLSEVVGAEFTLPHSEKVYSTGTLKGRYLSFSRSLEEDDPFLTAQFEIDNSAGLLPGSYVDVFMQLKPKSNALLVPLDALLEDYGQFSVMVQTAGNSFEKRAVITGIRDAHRVEILSGLQEGERVVTYGAYQVKMAAASSSVPAHGHVH